MLSTLRRSPPRPGRGTRRICGAFLAALACCGSACGAGAGRGGAASRVHVVVAGENFERSPRAGQSDEYELRLRAGQFVHVVVDQLGIDVLLRLYAPAGRQLTEVDSPTGTTGPERVAVVAPVAGRYRLQVSATSAKPGGRYAFHVVAWRDATPADRLEVAAERAFDRGEGLRRATLLRDALPRYQQALVAWTSLGNVAGEALALNGLGEMHQRMGEMHHRLDELDAAVALYRQALRTLAPTGDIRSQAGICNRMGRALLDLFRFDEALAAHRRALALFRQLTDRKGIATALNNEGNVYLWLGKNQSALDAFDAALPLWDRRTETHERMLTLINMGNVLTAEEQLDEAAAVYREAIAEAIAEAGRLHDPAALAKVLSREGFRLYAAGQPALAIDRLRQAIDLHRQLHDPVGYVDDLLNLGVAYLKQGDLRHAGDALSQARQLYRQAGNRHGEAMALLDLGRLAYTAGDFPRALALYTAARQLFVAVRGRQGEVSAIYGCASTLLRLGRPAEARDQIALAVDGLENLRGETASRSLRQSYFASRQNYWDLYVQTLMLLDARHPGGGYAAQAFAISERRRSRSLLDLLGQAAAAAPAGGERGAAAEENELQQQLDAIDRHRLLLMDRQGSAAAVAALDRLQQQKVIQLDRARARQASQDDLTAAPSPAAALSLTAVQALLGRDDMLLEYALGEPTSYLWAVTHSSCKSFRLTGRAAIEAAARAATDLLRRTSVKAQTAQEQAARQLSSLVLAPAAAELGQARRLLIVADGDLLLVPFAALPDPAAPPSETSPLVVRHEIVTPPSATVLAALRRRSRQQPTPPAGVAVFADPVFRSDDPRLAPAALPAGAAPGPSLPPAEPPGLGLLLRDFHLAGLARLPATAGEAAAIAQVAPSGTVVAMGFAASRERVLDGSLRRFRYLHFATHSLVDALHPDLSGIVLSLRDQRGQPQDGILRLYEIYDLDLPARLVVLSGCETGLGQPVAGEGLVGLSWGFLHAGAQGVVVSLWNVQDDSTAELMRRFYTALFAGHASAPAALRQAQLSMLASTGWRAPYHWAGFVFTGDWEAAGKP